MKINDSRIESWLRTNRGKKSPAIIMGSSVNGLSFARSLGRRGIPTLLLDSTRFTGAYTRYGTFLLLPPAAEQPQVWIDLLAYVGSRLDAPGVIFPTSDEHGLLVSQQRDVLQRYFRFLVPDAQTMARLVNKRSQYEIAQAANTPVPKTYFPESVDDVRRVAVDVSYPCLLKPYQSHIGRQRLSDKKLLVVHSRVELISAYERIGGSDIPFMIQEIIPGEDSALFAYMALWDANGRELAWLTRQKLRQYPSRFGNGSLVVTVAAPEVAEMSRHLLRAVNYCGFGYVEFKLDARDRTYRLIEINPRTVGATQLAISAGVDFPWLGYQHLMGYDLEPLPAESVRLGVRYVHEVLDIQAYLALRTSDDLDLWTWLRSLRGVKARAIGAWDDPLPLARSFWRALEVLARYLFRRIALFVNPRRIPADEL